jgi:hypothetical protein
VNDIDADTKESLQSPLDTVCTPPGPKSDPALLSFGATAEALICGYGPLARQSPPLGRKVAALFFVLRMIAITFPIRGPCPSIELVPGIPYFLGFRPSVPARAWKKAPGKNSDPMSRAVRTSLSAHARCLFCAPTMAIPSWIVVGFEGGANACP